MILKSLTLQGFKSFPDRTEIRFTDGITAIVGPNGSGKSNISDAIRWVLGEQSSRSLRGAKMEDVIFGGTAKRGPQGFAEVSLLLNNESGVFRSEYLEVMVTRRYYRSGESEYYLNRKHCRLRDIHELFMDTGLGRDGYSSIGQGRIDEILSLRSEDRREIFEEAAGVTKFRYRKEEAERKLNAAEENLIRIRDIYGELESRSAPLAKQAERAREYLCLRDELRGLELTLWLHALERIDRDSEKLEQNAKICTRQLEDAEHERERLQSRSEELVQALRQADCEMEDLRRQLRENEKRQADSGSRCAVLQVTIRNAEENRVRAMQEQERHSERAEHVDAQIAARQGRIAALHEENEGLQQRSAALLEEQKQVSRHMAELAAEHDRVQREIAAANDRRFAQELAQTAAQTALDSMHDRRQTLAADLEQSAMQLQQETEQAAAFARECEQGAAEAEMSRNRLAGITRKAEQRRESLTACEEKQRGITTRLDACTSRIRILTEMQRDYEGFSRAVKLVMGGAAAGTMHGVHGPVSSLIEVEPRFITAIETALGAAGANLVVDTAADAKRAIGYLQRRDGGRATFLPIDTIRPSALREQGLAGSRGFLGTADQLICCDARYRDIISNLLARTVVAENLDAALALAKSHGYRFRIVTLDGQIVQAGGAMTGGSAAKSSGVLARTEQLSRLTEEQETLGQQEHEAQEELRKLKNELAEMEFDIKEAEDTRAHAQEEQARLEARNKQHGLLLESLRMRHEGLERERGSMEDARAAYAAQIEAAQTELEQAAQQAAVLDAHLQLTQEQMTAADGQQAALAAQGEQLRTAQAKNSTETEAEERALVDLEQVRSGMKSGAQDAEKRIDAFDKEAENARQELLLAEEQTASSAVECETLRGLLAAAAQQRLRVEGDKTAADTAAQSQNDNILGLERESSRLSAQLTQLKGERSQILDRMWDSYELTPTPAKDAAVEVTDLAAAKEHVQSLRIRMKNMGNINLDAIEEYARIVERMDFISTQKADLEHAQAELYRVIDELTVHMKEIFASEFAKLNVYFGETFREIFGGGHASLQLADSSDILHCGIDILVCPPGKAVKTLTLLSGGEKAFVAIALYFAILKLRPASFCVLDEIEAALDDVNVQRFADYLKRLTDQTQFIVITHRRGTMEAADMLYGVTMQEQGVSRLLMLNLAEAERHISEK